MSESSYSGSSTEDGIDCEDQLKNGIAPRLRIASNGVVGKEKFEHGLVEQSAKGEENSISEGALPTSDSNLVTAFMSQGASSPVSWLPIQAPQ